MANVLFHDARILLLKFAISSAYTNLQIQRRKLLEGISSVSPPRQNISLQMCVHVVADGDGGF